MLYPCPACGFEVFGEPPGSYDICPLCNWEDDAVQLRFPLMGGGANKECLAEWQARAIRQLPAEIVAHGEYRRAPDWRPLTPEDCGNRSGMPANGIRYFEAAGAEPPQYYWLRSRGPGS